MNYVTKMLLLSLIHVLRERATFNTKHTSRQVRVIFSNYGICPEDPEFSERVNAVYQGGKQTIEPTRLVCDVIPDLSTLQILSLIETYTYNA